MTDPYTLKHELLAMLDEHLADKPPTDDQQHVIDHVLTVNSLEYLGRGPGAGKTTARLMAARALLEDE